MPTVLENAELLLRYAADNGLTVDASARLAIFAARQEYVDDSLKPQSIAELYAAYTALAVASHPVTAETIRACQAQSDGTLKRYQHRVLLLTAFVISLGVISFVSSSITQKISDDITSANALAVKLGAQLGVLPNPQNIFDNSANTGLAPANPQVQSSVARTPAATTTDQGLPPGVVASDVIAELQQFTTQIRDIYRRAVSLNAFLPIEHDPFSAEKNIRRSSGKLFNCPPKLTTFVKQPPTKFICTSKFGPSAMMCSSIRRCFME